MEVGLSLTSQLDLGLPFIWLPSAKITGGPRHMPGICMASGEPHSAPYICAISTLPSEPSVPAHWVDFCMPAFWVASVLRSVSFGWGPGGSLGMCRQVCPNKDWEDSLLRGTMRWVPRCSPCPLLAKMSMTFRSWQSHWRPRQPLELGDSIAGADLPTLACCCICRKDEHLTSNGRGLQHLEVKADRSLLVPGQQTKIMRYLWMVTLVTISESWTHIERLMWQTKKT